ncbi:hypothetical protein [uncultured Cohaesibacter sp.]|uniref:hypothetical protein n=1 Tax=uncultured Cohaesibacter sp. TaxID=1002546 RepID=UPI002930FC24|nr:hypothetical protein [uncultured Cohaesibacter sp.]
MTVWFLELEFRPFASSRPVPVILIVLWHAKPTEITAHSSGCIDLYTSAYQFGTGVLAIETEAPRLAQFDNRRHLRTPVIPLQIQSGLTGPLCEVRFLTDSHAHRDTYPATPENGHASSMGLGQTGPNQKIGASLSG